MRLLSLTTFAAFAVLAPTIYAQTSDSKKAPKDRLLPGEQKDGSVLVTTNQMVTPLGKVQTLPGERARDLALSPDGSLVAVLTTSKVHIYKLDGTLEGTVTVSAGPLGVAWH